MYVQQFLSTSFLLKVSIFETLHTESLLSKIKRMSFKCFFTPILLKLKFEELLWFLKWKVYMQKYFSPQNAWTFHPGHYKWKDGVVIHSSKQLDKVLNQQITSSGSHILSPLSSSPSEESPTISRRRCNARFWISVWKCWSTDSSRMLSRMFLSKK